MKYLILAILAGSLMTACSPQSSNRGAGDTSAAGTNQQAPANGASPSNCAAIHVDASLPLREIAKEFNALRARCGLTETEAHKLIDTL